MHQVVELFLKFVQFGTASNEDEKNCPSSEGQRTFGMELIKEMKAIGLQQVAMDENAYVFGLLPANTDRKIKAVGLIAHLDTSPDFNGNHVQPVFHHNYDGSEILLSEKSGLRMNPSEFPELKNYLGQTLITTDGTSLLGADDKAGIAEILTAVDQINRSNVEHGDVWVCFNPDEEIGRGADLFDLKKFPVDFALTVDGGPVGECEYENFNAAGVQVEIAGRSVHPGAAKNKMINSLELAMQFHHLLPQAARPEYTSGFDGFIHLIKIEGQVEKTVLSYIIRDHSSDKFQQFKNNFLDAAAFLNQRNPGDRVHVKIQDQYQNMKTMIEPHPYILEIVGKAMQQAGIALRSSPIRGGTDGAQLSFMGLPTPNLFTGGHNAHGPYEFIPVESMEKAVEVIQNVIIEVARCA